MDLGDGIDRAIDLIAGSDKYGVKLEDCDPSLLDVKDYDLETHLRMQPAGVAYLVV